MSYEKFIAEQLEIRQDLENAKLVHARLVLIAADGLPFELESQTPAGVEALRNVAIAVINGNIANLMRADADVPRK